MRKPLLVILVAIMAMVAVAGCTSQSNGENKNKIFTGDNITFEYPQSWVVAKSQANDTIVAVADPKSVNPQTGYAQTLVVIQKKSLEGSLIICTVKTTPHFSITQVINGSRRVT